MKNLFSLSLVSLLLISIGSVFANSPTDTVAVKCEDQTKSVDNADFDKAIRTLAKSVTALEKLMVDPTNSIPPSLLTNSQGIVIFPSAFKVAIGIAGGQGARGVAMVRMEDGSWSNPFFVSMGEGSLGFQIGAQQSDIVLLFKNKNDILAIDRSEITLGSDVGVTAGPVSQGTSVNTDIKFDSEIYSYCRSKGLFAGVSFKGGILTINDKVNESLYSMKDVNTDDIFNSMQTPYNENVNELMMAVNNYEK